MCMSWAGTRAARDRPSFWCSWSRTLAPRCSCLIRSRARNSLAQPDRTEPHRRRTTCPSLTYADGPRWPPADNPNGKPRKEAWIVNSNSVAPIEKTDTSKVGVKLKVVVIGGTGLIGSKLVAKLREHGHEAVAAALNTGVNTLTCEGLDEALRGASVVVDVSNSPSFDGASALK